MKPAFDAADPRRNVTVHASAGTGKTWLLVTRVIRLLLAGARPDGILALTFTRKAAAEMQSRINQRLRDLACADETSLDAKLAEMGLQPDQQLRHVAGSLYEQLLFNEHPLRTTTFHAFCQDLLQRFPLEAAVPPGFDLLESAGSVEQEALDALYTEATRNNAGPLAQALDQLFEGCSGLTNTRQALLGFLSHRSDWWAYTAQRDPLGHATKALSELLAVDPSEDPAGSFFNARRCGQLQEYAQLLGLHPTKTNDKYAKSINDALMPERSVLERLDDVRSVFLKHDGEPRDRKTNATQARKMGEQGEHRFLALHELIGRDVLELNDQLARQNTWRLSRAWMSAGIQLVEDYQRLKRERRLLDFADLEWHTYRLLNTSGNAHWVQYKLDARIDHLLIDEFQDTNPTQWRLILPLLEELAAGESDRARSAFIVGDAKQSIYRFRRANAALLDTAAAWMEDRLAAGPYTLDASRRSAPAIIECVNRVFSAPQLEALVPDYHPHDTHRNELWGRVELSPLIESPPVQQFDAGPALRDPLQCPRRVPEELRYHEEGRWIAEHILHLVTNETLIGPPAQARQVRLGDILILLRSRNHAHAYEHALRQAGIPYLGAGRGTLLESLEVRDLEALLNTLVTPYNNLALAQVLRSPVFAVSNADLAKLAEAKPGSWIVRLERLSKTLPEDSPLLRAYEFLQQWRELAGHTPVHDLLDRIYHDADILARYRSAYPEPLRPRVIANLTRFIELALDVDSGRYPSLPRFLNRLQGLRTTAPDAPDETPPESDADARVRMMTIHGAKGLEAPVVFLADTTAAAPRQRAYQAIVDWPADAKRPSHFLLSGPKSARDSVSARLIQQQEVPGMREEANLLYVALTRASQLLFISGSAPKRPRDSSWYNIIHAQLAVGGAESQDGGLVLRSGTPPQKAAAIPPVSVCDPPSDPRLSKPVQIQPLQREIAPSRMVEGAETGDATTHGARQRGLAIHTMLETLTAGLDLDDEKLLPQLAIKLGHRPDDPDLLAWWQEACGVRDNPQFVTLFQKEHYVRAYSEVPIQYYLEGDLIYGIIDRLVEYDHEALVIDYKSHAHAKSANAKKLAQDYAGQLHLYAEGIRKIWPQKKVRAGVLFTACNELVILE